jgi:hypothetical protein
MRGAIILLRRMKDHPAGSGQEKRGGVVFKTGVTWCKQGGSGSSDRFCPPIEGERKLGDGGDE